MERIVILDGHTTNPGDLSWERLRDFGQLIVYERTPAPEVIERALPATILLTNKVVLNEVVLQKLPSLKMISVLATGYNVVDVAAAQRRGILVCNVRGYAANAVAQHVFALLLQLTNKVADLVNDVKKGGWQKASDWSYLLHPWSQLASQIMGIYGFGQIGKKVADIALAFGMKVIIHHKHPDRDVRPGVSFVPFRQLLMESDVLTLHAPLTAENQGIINQNSLRLMKTNAILINTARGGLIVEEDLRFALEHHIIAGAALDVLSEEPPRHGNPLIGLENCLVTPHCAWTAKEARAALIEETCKNVAAFLNGSPRNVCT